MEVSGNEMQLCKRHSDQEQFFEGEDVVLALVHVHHRAPHQLHEDLVVGLVELHVERLRTDGRVSVTCALCSQ